MIKIVTAIALTLVLAACATPAGPQRFTGIYALAFEMQAFTPTQAHASARASAPRSRAR